MKKGIGILILLIFAAGILAAQEPEWNPANVKPCDRACLVGFMDRYMQAIYTKDRNLLPPLSKDYRMTENTGVIEVPEGALWRRTMEPTSFMKGIVSVWALFIHDGTRRNARPGAPPGMLQNLVTVETFGIRDGLIHEVEVFPFVTLPYGLGDGWTAGSGR